MAAPSKQDKDAVYTASDADLVQLTSDGELYYLPSVFTNGYAVRADSAWEKIDYTVKGLASSNTSTAAPSSASTATETTSGTGTKATPATDAISTDNVDDPNAALSIERGLLQVTLGLIIVVLGHVGVGLLL